MRNILVTATLVLASTFSYAATAPAAASAASAASAPHKAETKKVCVDKVKDGKPVLDKQGKPAQDCKQVKIHKKLEGTKVEDAKKGK